MSSIVPSFRVILCKVAGVGVVEGAGVGKNLAVRLLTCSGRRGCAESRKAGSLRLRSGRPEAPTEPRPPKRSLDGQPVLVRVSRIGGSQAAESETNLASDPCCLTILL